jgi:hypothetical protein
LETDHIGFRLAFSRGGKVQSLSTVSILTTIMNVYAN